MNKHEKKGLGPERRFPEFREEWQRDSLGKFIEIKGRIGYRGYTVDDIVKKGEGAISLSPSNIDEFGTLSFDNSTYISWDKYEESPEIMLRDGFTVLVKTGSSYGKAALIGRLPVKVTINPQLVVLKPISVNSVFLYLVVSSASVQRQIKAAAVGGAIPTLSQENISKFEVLIPCEDEQQKIADCLTSIDELITAQTQKLEALKTHKKGLMQQLFPAKGETVPKLRFPEFRDAEDWEEKRLGDIGSVRMCKRIVKEQTNPSGEIPFYKIGTFSGAPDAFISREIFENYRNNFPFPKNGAVLISAAGTIGRTVLYKGELAYFQDSNIVWLDNNEKLIVDSFLFYLYQLINWTPSVGTIQRLYNENILGARAKFPSIPEQQKIADCLAPLDDLITTQIQKLDSLKAHKKGLMRQLFPAVDEVDT